MVRDVIPIHKRYLVIDSPIDFVLIANNGTDEVYRPAGAWRLDMWSLLSKEYFRQYPVFTLEIEYDNERIPEGKNVVYRQSDIDLGSGLAGVNGQLVQVENFPSNLPTLENQNTIKDRLNNYNDYIIFGSYSEFGHIVKWYGFLPKYFIDRLSISWFDQSAQINVVVANGYYMEVPNSSPITVYCPLISLFYDNDYFIIGYENNGVYTDKMINTDFDRFSGTYVKM